MSRQKAALFGAAATFAIFTMQSGVAQAADEATAAAPSSASVSEIVVTANKRQESVNKVGMSIAAATGAQLTRLGITDTSQLQKIVPGFSYVPSAYGTPVYSIRGVGFQDTSLAASPTVSVYVDEAPLPFSAMTQGASLDLQRVEVLKGPQGTLFGENATGGAINYIANKPTDHFQAGADLSYGRFNTLDVQGFVSGPITDTLDFRIALRTIQGDGWQKSYGPQSPASMGKQSFYNGRASLLWKPNDRFKALLTLSGYQDGGETQAPQLYGSSALNTNTTLPPGLVNFPLAPHDDRAADWSPCVNSGPFWGAGEPAGSPTRCTNYHKNNTFYMGSLRMDYDLGNDMVLTSLTTHEKFDRYTPLEGDGTTYNDYQSLQQGFLNTTYQEVRLAGKFGGKGNWIVGGNYEYDSTWDNFLQTYSDSSSSTVFGQFLGPARPIDRQKTTTYAIYGNAEYPVTDTITLQAGIRYTNSKKDFYGCGLDSGDGSWASISQLIQNYLEGLYAADPSHTDAVTGQGINVGPGGCGTTQAAPAYAPGITYEHLNEDNVSWRAGVNWKVTPQVLAYFNASQGWKSGGFPTIATASYAQLTPAKQEGLLAYEGGFKAALFDHQLQLNAAGFYYDYHDKQILGDLNDIVFGALPSLVNVPKSHVIGFEVSGVWTPEFLHGLTITPAVSYAGSKIDHCSPSLVSCAPVAANPPPAGNVPVAIPGGDFHNFDYLALQRDFNGEAFPNAPQWQASVDAQYEWNLRDDVRAFVGATATYTGDTNSGFGNHPELNVPAYTLVDLRAGVEKDSWRVQFWGRNVANQYYWTTAYHVNDVYVRYTGMPATYGVTISYRYH
jgi:iron complex outermembrane receptor protein